MADLRDILTIGEGDTLTLDENDTFQIDEIRNRGTIAGSGLIKTDLSLRVNSGTIYETVRWEDLTQSSDIFNTSFEGVVTIFGSIDMAVHHCVTCGWFAAIKDYNYVYIDK